MTAAPLISIIVPVYNAEKYLNRCVDSITAQTFTDWECILIDDGSTDNTPAICDEYVVKDPRIKVFHKENGGVSSSRNLGISKSEGDFLTFVDADDWVEPYYLANMIRHISDVDEGVYIRTYAYEDNEKGTACCSHSCKDNNGTDSTIIAYTKMEFANLIEKEKLLYATASWGKLYSKTIIDKYKICFPLEISHEEDLCFVIKYIRAAYATNSKCVVVSMPGYHYILRNSDNLSSLKVPPLELLNMSLKVSDVFDDMLKIVPLTKVTANDIYTKPIDFFLRAISLTPMREQRNIYNRNFHHRWKHIRHKSVIKNLFKNILTTGRYSLFVVGATSLRLLFVLKRLLHHIFYGQK